MADTRRDVLHHLTLMVEGHHYRCAHAGAILDGLPEADWSQYWPLVDSQGRIVGGVVSSDDDGWVNVANEAAIMLADMTDEQRARVADDYIAYI